MTAFDGTSRQPTTERRAASAVAAELPAVASVDPADDLGIDVSNECRLRRELRKLGQRHKPQNVLDFLVAAKARGDPLSLRVFK